MAQLIPLSLSLAPVNPDWFYLSGTGSPGYHYYNHFTALWTLSGTTRVRRYHKKHSPTHSYRGQQSSLCASSIFYDPWHPPCPIYLPDSHTQTPPFYGSLDFVWDFVTHSHSSWSSIIPICFLYLLRSMTVFFHKLSPIFLWSTSSPGTLHFILHTFLNPVIPLQPVLL